jgi:hypothetical protein
MTFEVTVTTMRVYKIEATSPEDAKRAVESGVAVDHLHEMTDKTAVHYVNPIELTGLCSALIEPA